jgi:hypothetical protein
MTFICDACQQYTFAEGVDFRLEAVQHGSAFSAGISLWTVVYRYSSFARFLSEVGVLLGTCIDLTKLAQRATISGHAVPRYFEILEY